MKINIRKYLLLGFALLNLTAADAQKNSPKGKQPLTYQAFYKQDMKKYGDELVVYVKDNKYYLEVPQRLLDTNLLASAIIVEGPWRGTSATSTDLVRFTLGRDNTLDVMQNFLSDRIDEEAADAGLVAALKSSSMQPVKHSFPIHAFTADRKGYILDITKDVTASGFLFDFSNRQWVNRPVANRSRVDSIYTIGHGLKFICMHSQSDKMPGGMGQPPKEYHQTVRIERAIQILGNSTMPVRKADSRVGYASIKFNEFGDGNGPIKKEAIIRRWKLQPKAEDMARYLSGEPVEPEEPIVVYFDNTFTPGYRKAAHQAVADWNKAFEKAGFKDALKVIDGEPEAHWLYHAIVCTLGGMELEKTNTVSDPETGEVQAANLIFSTLIDHQVLSAQIDLGAYDPLVYSAKEADVRHQISRVNFSRQLGAVFGLIPNMMGSSAYTTSQLRDGKFVKEHGISASVMDAFPVNFVVQPGDKIDFEDLFGRVSHYDAWAINYGYRLFADKEAEKKGLKEIVMESKDNKLLAFYNITWPSAPTMKDDLAADELAAIRLALQNIKAQSATLEKVTSTIHPEYDNWYVYWKFFKPMTDKYMNFIKQAFNYIGDMQVRPVAKGYNNEHYAYRPYADQLEAIKLIEEFAFNGTPEWMKNTPMFAESGYNGESTMNLLMGTVAAGFSNGGILNYLLLTEKNNPGKKVYTADQYIKDGNRNIFCNFSASQKVNSQRRIAQFCYAENLIKSFRSIDYTKTTGDFPALMQVQMKKVLKEVERLSKSHADASSRNHYLGLSVYMKRELQKPEEKKEKKESQSNKK